MELHSQQKRARSRRKTLVVASCVLLVVAAGGIGAWWYMNQTASKPAVTQKDVAPASTPEPAQTPAAQPVAPTPVASSDPSSYQVIVNKKHPLSPLSYEPADLVTIGSQRLRTVPATAIRQMQADSGANVSITPASGYRSYQTQVSVYNSYVAKDGQAQADTYSARPGYSEHQTGLTMDFSPIDDAFANTSQFTWLQANAYRYGFVLRYPQGKTDITGYMYEPWHWRYIGVEAATDMHTKGVQTLEEYYNVAGGGY